MTCKTNTEKSLLYFLKFSFQHFYIVGTSAKLRTMYFSERFLIMKLGEVLAIIYTFILSR